MWHSLALGEWAFHNIREVCDDTENMGLAELV